MFSMRRSLMPCILSSEDIAVCSTHNQPDAPRESRTASAHARRIAQSNTESVCHLNYGHGTRRSNSGSASSLRGSGGRQRGDVRRLPRRRHPTVLRGVPCRLPCSVCRLRCVQSQMHSSTLHTPVGSGNRETGLRKQGIWAQETESSASRLRPKQLYRQPCRVPRAVCRYGASTRHLEVPDLGTATKPHAGVLRDHD